LLEDGDMDAWLLESLSNTLPLIRLLASAFTLAM
jgi:hypothetical protein